MRESLSFVLALTLAPWACPQEKGKDQKAVSPGEVAKQWIDAAAKRDGKSLERLACKATPKQSLKLLQEQGFVSYQGEAKIMHEETSGDRAVVVYRLENRNAAFTAEVRYDLLTLVQEGKEWKVDTQGGGVLKAGKQ
jgi:hypothetical protein